MAIRVQRYDRGQVEPRPRPRARLDESVDPGAFGAGVGRALEQTSQVAEQIAQRERDRADNAALQKADTELDAWENSSLFDPQNGAFAKRGENAFGLPGQVMPGYDEEAKRIEGTLGSRRAKDAFRAQASRRRGQITTQLGRHELQERDGFYDEQAAAKLRSSAEMAGNYFSDPERIASELAKQDATIEERGKRKGLSADVIEQEKRAQRAGVHFDVVNRYLASGDVARGKIYFEEIRDQLPSDLAAKLEIAMKGARLDAIAADITSRYAQSPRAGAAAVAALSKSDLTPAEQLQVRGQVQSGLGVLHAERRREHAEEVNALERSISQGNPSDTAEQEAERLYRRGAYTPDQYTNVLQSIDTARAKAAKDGITVAAFEDAFTTGKRLDPKDEKVRDTADVWFKKVTELNDMKPGSDEWINSAAQVASRTNILPNEAMSWARRTLLANDPALTVPAANAMQRFADAAPTAWAYFDDPNIKAFASQVDSMVRAGVDHPRAVEIARANSFDIPKARQDALEAKWKNEKYAADYAGELQDFMDGDDAFEVGISGTAPEPPLAMQDDYGELVRTYFDHTNGDIEQARELAWRDLRGTYGISRINGEPEVLKYAPELVFPGLDTDVVRQDVDASAKAAGVEMPVRLVPARVTGDTHGLLWNLQTADDDGNLELVLDDKNRPLIYAIPTDTKVYLEAQEAAKRKAVDEARAESARRRATVEAMENYDPLKNEFLQ